MAREQVVSAVGRRRPCSASKVHRAIAVGAVLVIVGAGCDSNTDSAPDDSGATSTGPTTTAPDATSSSAPSTTTTPATSTSTTTTTTTTAPITTIGATTTTAPPVTTSPATVATTVPPACPEAPPLAAGATDSTSVAADVDGDGLADLVTTYVVPSEARWHVRVEFGVGGSADATIVDSGTLAPARPIGGHDVDGDGTEEAFVTVGSGASAVLVGLYDIAACGLARVTIGAEPAVFPIGATVGNVSGLACDVGDLDRLFAQQVDDDEYEGGFEPFTLTGSVLTPGPGDGGSFSAAEAAALAVLDCGTLTLP